METSGSTESPASRKEVASEGSVNLDESGPFMSLVLQRLDLNNLPEKASGEMEIGTGDENVFTDTSGSRIDELGRRRSLRKVKQRSVEGTDQSDFGNVTIGLSSHNLRKRKTNEDLLHIEDSDNLKSPERSIGLSRKQNSTGKNDPDYDFVDEISDEDLPKSRNVRRKSKNRKFSRTKKDRHEYYCRTCGDGGELICCDACPHVFHLSCLEPPLISVPKGSWKCFTCSIEPLDKVDRIFTWRFKGDGREFFVHFAGKSHWECRWVPDYQLQIFHPYLIKCYYKKHGDDAPPNLDERDARRQRKNNHNPLEVRFYQNGVRPEWLRINRIIDHYTERDGNLSYLVKWQELGYDSTTWEDEDSCKEIAAEFSEASRVYHERLNLFCGDPDLPTAEKPFIYKHLVIAPKRPVSNLTQKLEKQPDYVPKGMILHDYQLEGLNWLRYSWAKGTNTILGDEMGLGKTIQAIMFLSSLYREGHSKGPFLISAPLSTILNWEREFEAWAPELYVVTYTGDQDTRLLIRQAEFVEDSSKFNKRSKRIVESPVKFHVLLTSYQFPTIDATCLGSIPWKMIIVDEGHRLKDDGTLLFKDLMKYTTSYKLLLTGTPLQNNLEELFNLLNFLCPEKFGDVSAFLTEFEDIAKEDQIKRLHTLLGPHLLRRMKVDVLKDLPSKSELIVRVELSPMQKQYSKHILMKNFQALNAKGGRQTSLLNVFMDLRKICNHPYLFSKACAEAPEDPVTGLYELEAMTEASGKLVMLRKMLELLKKQGHRVLIFSQMTTVMDILEEFIENLGYAYERIDGSINGAIRQDSIDRFNAEGAEQFVFLLSTKAGGLGINLATADTVIIYDSDWNPHNDIQAFSRAHRIGQKNKVMIYRFVTRRSVEEKMVEVCKKKLMLTHLVVRPEAGKALFSKDEVEDIIRFGTEELFKDKGANAPIYYTDAMIEAILDRTQEEVSEKSDWTNDYFQGFKVANCDIHEEIEGLSYQEDAKGPDQWKYLLRQEIKRNEEDRNDLTNYGKGKRQRPPVRYSDRNNADKRMEIDQRNQIHPNLPLVKHEDDDTEEEWDPSSYDVVSSPSSEDAEDAPTEIHKPVAYNQSDVVIRDTAMACKDESAKLQQIAYNTSETIQISKRSSFDKDDGKEEELDSPSYDVVWSPSSEDAEDAPTEIHKPVAYNQSDLEQTESSFKSSIETVIKDTAVTFKDESAKLQQIVYNTSETIQKSKSSSFDNQLNRRSENLNEIERSSTVYFVQGTSDSQSENTAEVAVGTEQLG